MANMADNEDIIDIEEVGTQVEVNTSPANLEDSVEIVEDGSAIINPEELPLASGFNSNLAEILDEAYLQELSNELVDKIEVDKSSREDWEQAYTKGLDLLGFKYEERTRPFRGAASVNHPVLAQAVTQFQAMAYVELLPSDGPVRTQVVGANTDQMQMAAERVKDYMNYEITHVMEDYNPEMDQLLFQLPLSGSAFKKVYYDEVLGRATSKFVPSEDVIVPYGASDLDTCDRITQVVKMSMNDLRKKQVSGFYRDIDLQPYDGREKSNIQEKMDSIDGVKPTNYGMSDMTELFEIHVNLDLEGFEDINPRNGEPSGISLPYIVTIDRSSNKVLSIYRNYNENDPLKKKNEYFVHYKFLPGLGFYGFGLIHMIGGLTRTATAALRQLLDAGTLSNLPAGYKARGLRIRDDDQPLQPGEFRDVDAPNGIIREALMPLPYKGPDAVLMQLLGFCVDAAKQFATVADMQLSEIGSSQTPVGTTMALMERGTKVMSAVHKRLHYAQKKEFELLARIFKMVLPPVYPFDVPGGPREIKVQEYKGKVISLAEKETGSYVSKSFIVHNCDAPIFKNKTVLITGGTGFLGRSLIKEILKHDPQSIRIFSRDEFKHHKTQELFGHDERLRNLIGDVRDYQRLKKACEGVDIVIHAAALKRLDILEYNVEESLCNGCGKCVKGCTVFGNGSLFLQVRHDRCLNCNECSIAAACPSQAYKRVPANEPYLLKKMEHA